MNFPKNLSTFCCFSLFSLLLEFSGAHATPPPEGDAPPTHHYSAYLPAGSLSCYEAARQWGDEFSVATNAGAVDTQCLDTIEISTSTEKFSLHSVALNYREFLKIRPHTALFGSLSYSNEPTSTYGVYPTFAACMNDLPQQKNLFERETGLRAVTSTCLPETAHRTDRRQEVKSFILMIDGFGLRPALKQFRGIRLHFHGTLIPSMITEIERVFALGKTALAKLTKDGAYYYSEHPPLLRNEYFGRYSPEQCQEQLPAIRGLFQALEVSDFFLDCVPTTPGEVALESFRGPGTKNYSYQSFIKPYYTYQECMRDRARSLEVSRSEGRAALAALCRTRLLGDVEMEVYYRY